MKALLPLVMVFVLTGYSSSGQSLTLKHRTKDKTKNLSFHDDLIFETADTVYKHHHIVSVTETLLVVANFRDTVSIPITTLTVIKKYNFKKRGILEPFVYLAALSAAGMVIFPIAALAESDGHEALNVLGVMAAVTAFSGGVILIMLSKRSFDLTTKWKIVPPTDQ